MPLENLLSQNLEDYSEEQQATIRRIIEEDQVALKAAMAKVAQTLDRPAVLLGAVGFPDGISQSAE